MKGSKEGRGKGGMERGRKKRGKEKGVDGNGAGETAHQVKGQPHGQIATPGAHVQRMERGDAIVTLLR